MMPFALPLTILAVATVSQYVADALIHVIPSSDAEKDPRYGPALYFVVGALLCRWFAAALAIIEGVFRVTY